MHESGSAAAGACEGSERAVCGYPCEVQAVQWPGLGGHARRLPGKLVGRAQLGGLLRVTAELREVRQGGPLRDLDSNQAGGVTGGYTLTFGGRPHRGKGMPASRPGAATPNTF